MAKQVRPWLAKPKMTAAPRVRESDWEPISQTHQGQRLKPQLKSECTGQSDPVSPHELKAWTSGVVHVRSLGAVNNGSIVRHFRPQRIRQA